ncbi:MAG: Ppx/GppA family phosphatase [Acidobacteria bacterium]|nr:Ppx/GppA family phosphatase [Acidobacteriota bacterium]
MKIAAIDIGSNSIHLVIVRAVEGQHIEIIDREKEVVRLGAGLQDHRLSKEATERAILTLRRFRQMAQANRVDLIITTATAAVREATNAEKFIDRVRKEVGLEVQLLPGVEEARLIALAVAEITDFNHRRALIIDIGGGSTEFIISDGREPQLLLSVRLGAVRLTERFISTDPPSPSERENLIAAIRADLTHAVAEIKQLGFDFIIGTSGTILNMTEAILQAEAAETDNASEFEAFSPTITLEQIHQMNRQLAAMEIAERRLVPGLEEKRADIIIAGGLLLETILHELHAQELTQCDWSLREGVVLDYLRQQKATHSGLDENSPLLTGTDGRRLEQGNLFDALDVRTRSVLSVARHFEYDAPHSHHVADLATRLFNDTQPLHELGDTERRLLQYAALLHDIGYRVAHNEHHRHGLYLIKNSEMPGFTANEIAMVGVIVRYHRGAMPKKPKNKREKREHEDYYSLKRADRAKVLRLAAILQIADGLDRSHSQNVRRINSELSDAGLQISVHSNSDCDLELWSAERKAKWFTDIFRVPIHFKAQIAPALQENKLFSVAD